MKLIKGKKNVHKSWIDYINNLIQQYNYYVAESKKSLKRAASLKKEIQFAKLKIN